MQRIHTIIIDESDKDGMEYIILSSYRALNSRRLKNFSIGLDGSSENPLKMFAILEYYTTKLRIFCFTGTVRDRSLVVYQVKTASLFEQRVLKIPDFKMIEPTKEFKHFISTLSKPMKEAHKPLISKVADEFLKT